MSWLTYATIGSAAFGMALAIVSWLTAPKKLSIPGKAAVITGGSLGIGLSVAKQLAASGCSVALWARKEGPLKDAQKEVEAVATGGAKVIITPTDVTNEGACVAGAQAAVEAFGRLDMVINVAGFSTPRMFDDLSADQWRAMYNVNVIGTRNATYACLPHIRRQPQGRVVFTSSLAGQAGVAGFTGYSASKFALVGFAQALNMEIAHQNIHVTVLYPPDTDTPGLKAESDGKPIECQEISEGSGLFTADQVATKLISAVKAGDFAATVGFDGWAAGVLTAGTSPATLFQTFTESLLMGPLRLVNLAYAASFYGIVAKHAKKRRKSD